MINLSSLSALLRSLRQTSGPDGPASPVARVASVARVAKDDAHAVSSSGVRPSLWARRGLIPQLSSHTGTPHAETRHASAHTPRDSAPPTVRPGADATLATASDRQSAALDLTAGARLLQAALRGTGVRTPKPPTIASRMSLVSSAQAPVRDLARGLASAVTGSGLFYESHLARVLQRDYPIAALAREPQAAWRAPTVAESTTTPADALSETAATMLTQQLDALETRSLVWIGDVWPGRRATIAFEELGDREASGDAAKVRPSASRWRTRITLELPSLGRVAATLDLREEALDLNVAAANEHARARLTAAGSELAAALSAAELALGRFDVAIDADA